MLTFISLFYFCSRIHPTFNSICVSHNIIPDGLPLQLLDATLILPFQLTPWSWCHSRRTRKWAKVLSGCVEPHCSRSSPPSLVGYKPPTRCWLQLDYPRISPMRLGSCPSWVASFVLANWPSRSDFECWLEYIDINASASQDDCMIVAGDFL